MNKKPFLSLFTAKKPIFGLLHLKGGEPEAVLKHALLEAEQMITHGVSAVIVENYFGTVDDVEMVLQYFHKNKVPFLYGVNVLDDDATSFQFAQKYDATFLQLDSVAGHLTPTEDETFGQFIDKARKEYDGYVLGGVRFKYQPYRSGRSLAED